MTDNSNPEPPLGWQRCNGSAITEGPLVGQDTPDLNNQGLFLRGSLDGGAGSVQSDALKNHEHNVDDTGHTHSASGSVGSHGLPSAQYNRNFEQHNTSVHGNEKHGDQYDSGCYETQGSGCTTWSHSHSMSVSVSSRASGISVGSVTSGSSSETRPKNMAVVYVMRIF